MTTNRKHRAFTTTTPGTLHVGELYIALFNAASTKYDNYVKLDNRNGWDWLITDALTEEILDTGCAIMVDMVNASL